MIPSLWSKIPLWPRLKAKMGEVHHPLIWILFAGELVVATGRFMVWPFFAIYLNQRLGISLTTVGTLIALSSLSGVLTQVIGGPIVDRFGRRRPMLFAIALNTGFLAAFAYADSVEVMTLLLSLSGLVAVFDVAVNAMIADVTPPERRQEAYGLLRIALNVGAALGPAIGGFLVAVSYPLAFLIAAAAEAFYFFWLLFRTWETKTMAVETSVDTPAVNYGYGAVLRDLRFLGFLGSGTLVGLAYAIPWVLLSVHLKTNFGIPENMFGFLVTINALMVVFFQYPIARWLARFPKMPVMATAALLTGIGAGSIAYFNTYILFVLGMVIITLGELLSAPTFSAYVADIAPMDMRGRYMAAFGLTWGISFGLGPVLGGWLNDNFGPAAMWHGALLLGLASTVGFVLLSIRPQPKAEAMVAG